eukprot:CFRG7429T1
MLLTVLLLLLVLSRTTAQVSATESECADSSCLSNNAENVWDEGRKGSGEYGRADISSRSMDDCPCSVTKNGNCMNASFSQVVEEADQGDEIQLFTAYYVETPIMVNTSVIIKGGMCGPEIGKLVSKFDEGEKQEDFAMLFSSENIDLTLKDLIFERSTISNITYGTAFYANSNVGLTVTNCLFKNLRSIKHGGSAIYLRTAESDILIDKDTSFTGNSIGNGGCVPPSCVAPNGGTDQHACPDSCFGGGGALWIGSCFGSTKIEILSTFKNNVHEFGHGMGGAIFMDWMECQVTIDGVFENNTSSDGGAIHIESMQAGSSLTVDGNYTANQVVDGGWGCRGAALRVRNLVEGAIYTTSGTYMRNNATGTYTTGRGAVLALNNVDGVAYINITALDNICDGHGGVISNLYDFGDKANFTIQETSRFEGNTAMSDAVVVLEFQEQDIELSEAEWLEDKKNGGYVIRGSDFDSKQK